MQDNIQNLEGEIWKEVPDFNGKYLASSCGRIKNMQPMKSDRYHHDSPYIVGISTTKRGYKRVVIRYLGEKITLSIHRMVAKAFIPNPDNKSDVNHIDGNPSNNNLDNLEWCTSSENKLHSLKIGTSKPTSSKKVINIKNGRIFDSIKEAAESIGMRRANLAVQLSGKNNRINKTDFRLEENLNPFKEETNLDDYEIFQWNDNWNQLRTKKQSTP